MQVSTQQEKGLVARAEGVRVVAARHAGEADAALQLTPEVIALIRGAGFVRHFVSAEWGGSEATFAELTQAVRTVGEGCAAAAWCASLSAYSARFASHLPRAGHQAIWGQGPDVVIATGLAPAGRSAQVDGGWRLDGQWNYVSGIDFADWILVCAVSGMDGEAPAGATAQARFFAVPAGDYTVRKTWDSIGMRATGSHTAVVVNQFVPGHLSFARSDMLSGCNASSTVPSHNVPFAAVGGLTFLTPMLGAATGALNACVFALAGRRRTPSVELRLVRASCLIDAVHHLVEQNVEVLDQRRFTPHDVARNERNAAFGAETLVEAVSLLAGCAGAGGLAQAFPLQRFWRDVTAAANHVALNWDTAARRNYSIALLGPEGG